MKTRAVSALGCVALLWSATMALSLPARSYERAELFATCSGRMDALATRQRAYKEGAAPETEALSDTFQLLLDTVMPAALDDGVPPSQPRQWRNQGWSEVAALLAEVDTSFDAGRAARSKTALDKRIADCREVLL